MKQSKIDKVLHYIEEFRERKKALGNSSNPTHVYKGKDASALRRTSMELTRALSELRKLD
jgi:hypothetical protein